MSDLRVRVFDRTGAPLAELSVFAARSWALSRYTATRLFIAKTDSKATERNLRWGNLVLVENAGVGDWGGVIWPTEREGRMWAYNTISFPVFSAEFLLTLRRGPVNKPLALTGGATFTAMVNHASAVSPLPVQFGEVFGGGPVFPQTVRDDSVYEIVTRTSKAVGHDWNLDPEIDSSSGRLFFRAKWFERRGQSRALVLREGQNLKKIRKELDVLTEIGPLSNDVSGFSATGVWEARAFVTKTDTESQALYGLAQSSLALPENTPLAGVVAGTESALARGKQARRLFRLTALNVGDTLIQLGLGDVVGLELYRFGFAGRGGGKGLSTRVRVLSKSYDERSGSMPLVVEEVA